MFKGFVLSESLKDPTILNGFATEKVIVENHSEFEGELKIWHDFKLKIKDEDINSVCGKIAKQIKEEWYAHFWNENTVYVVLPDKIFKMPRESGVWKSSEYLECKKYAMKHGVEERFLTDFLIED
ncbi:MAG: hypothetical protein KKB25_01440 [Nanoarchaeota archaeon]|nr:hypothetical protein [Nanoarchaeota archaeon]